MGGYDALGGRVLRRNASGMGHPEQQTATESQPKVRRSRLPLNVPPNNVQHAGVS